jgi:DedD protein
MRGAFDDEYLGQRKSSSDAEITLGAGTLLLISAGLVVVCAVCFGIGYIVGHRGATPQAAEQIDNAPANPQASSSLQKPSATVKAAAPAPVQPLAQSDNLSQSPATDQPPSSAAVVPPSSTPSQALTAGQPQVRPALPTLATTPQATTPPSRTVFSPQQQQAQLPVRSALVSPAATLWVQVAAVSHVEDAQVLTGALHKRGYTVTPRREADNLIHVRIGPFASSDEANRWRVKLLDDGYNAEIQQ